MISPCLHSFLEMREVFWWFILSNVLSYISNIPKVSPLGIERRRIRCFSFVLSLEIVDDVVMLTGFLSVFWRCSNLEVLFRKDVWNRFSGIKLSWSFMEKLFHLIQELTVLFHIDSRIFDNQTPIFMKCICNSFTVLCIVSWLLKEVGNINNRDRGLTE